MSPRGAAGGHTTKEQDRDTSPGLRLRRLLFPAGGAARERGASGWKKRGISLSATPIVLGKPRIKDLKKPCACTVSNLSKHNIYAWGIGSRHMGNWDHLQQTGQEQVSCQSVSCPNQGAASQDEGRRRGRCSQAVGWVFQVGWAPAWEIKYLCPKLLEVAASPWECEAVQQGPWSCTTCSLGTPGSSLAIVMWVFQRKIIVEAANLPGVDARATGDTTNRALRINAWLAVGG